MSKPTYMIDCIVGPMHYQMKIRARLGNYDDAVHELKNMDWRRFLERMTEKYGGLAKMEREWNRNYAKLVGHDHHNVSTGQEYWDIVDKEKIMKNNESILVNGKEYVYSDYYQRLDLVVNNVGHDNESNEPEVLCPKCHNDSFKIKYGEYECIAMCVCGHHMVIYDG